MMPFNKIQQFYSLSQLIHTLSMRFLFFMFGSADITYIFILTFALKEGMPMLTIEGLIAVISLCLTAFGLGYAIGSNKTQK